MEPKELALIAVSVAAGVFLIALIVLTLKLRGVKKRVLPSTPMPPMDSVTHVGSPENSSLYSLIRINLTIRNFMTN